MKIKKYITNINGEKVQGKYKDILFSFSPMRPLASFNYVVTLGIKDDMLDYTYARTFEDCFKEAQYMIENFLEEEMK